MRNETPARPSRSQSGFSLIELLVVLAIIGVMSLVAVPAFVSMMQSSRLKSSLRQFATDLRGARQNAVTEYRWVKVDFETGTTPAVYWIRQSPDLGTTWSTGQRRELEPPVFIDTTTFTDGADDGDLPEIIFRNNGTVANIPSGSSSRVLVLKTPADVAKPTMTITVNTTGKVSAE